MRFAPGKSLLEECFFWMTERREGVFGIRRKRTEERFNAEFAENAECAEKRAGGGHGAGGFVESW
jgi:hypothetical protein